MSAAAGGGGVVPAFVVPDGYADIAPEDLAVGDYVIAKNNVTGHTLEGVVTGVNKALFGINLTKGSHPHTYPGQQISLRKANNTFKRTNAPPPPLAEVPLMAPAGCVEVSHVDLRQYALYASSHHLPRVKAIAKNKFDKNFDAEGYVQRDGNMSPTRIRGQNVNFGSAVLDIIPAVFKFYVTEEDREKIAKALQTRNVGLREQSAADNARYGPHDPVNRSNNHGQNDPVNRNPQKGGARRRRKSHRKSRSAQRKSRRHH
jgi:hypothetical protein